MSEFSANVSGLPLGIAVGPDGNIWFTESSSDQIGRMTPAGVITEFQVPTPVPPDSSGTPGIGPNEIAAGPDGNLWFTETSSNKIGRISLSGKISEYALPAGSSNPYAITTGSDGNLWFTESGNQIGSISPSGKISEYALPKGRSAEGITAGPDGNLWFTEDGGDKVGRITSGRLWG
jgi:virginiamycin B lyase